MHLLKAQKRKTSSACPKDSIERAERFCSPTSDLSQGHTHTGTRCLPLTRSPGRTRQDEAVLQKRSDCAVHLSTYGRTCCLKEKDLFSLTMVLSLCLTGPVQCDNSRGSISMAMIWSHTPVKVQVNWRTMTYDKKNSCGSQEKGLESHTFLSFA